MDRNEDGIREVEEAIAAEAVDQVAHERGGDGIEQQARPLDPKWEPLVACCAGRKEPLHGNGRELVMSKLTFDPSELGGTRSHEARETLRHDQVRGGQE